MIMILGRSLGSIESALRFPISGWHDVNN